MTINYGSDIVNTEMSPIIFKDKVIEDLICPKCSQKIDEDTDFCSCGFYFKAHKISEVYSFLFTLLGLFLFGIGLLFITGLLPTINSAISDKFNHQEIMSIASPRMYIETEIKKSDWADVIEDIYQQDYKNKNVLIVVIKPEIWPKLDAQKKTEIYNTINELWKKIYKEKNAVVKFGNPQN